MKSALILALAMTASAAHADDLKISDCMSVLAGLRGLDGRQVITNAGKPNEAVVTLPYEFGSALLRLKIASNIAALNGVEAAQEKARQDVFKELAGDAVEIKPNTLQFIQYNKQVADLQKAACGVQLQHFKADELRLDKNEIPGSVLGALNPIIDR